jgi:hypothetical protein
MLPPREWRFVDRAHARKMVTLYAGVVLGAVWLIVALLAQYNEDFILFGAFHDLGFLFWIAFTVLGLALVATLSWASLAVTDDATTSAAQAVTRDEPALDPVKLAPAWNPMNAPTEDRTTCARCNRVLPIWRMAEGTCTVCAPFSVFLDPPRKPSAELDKRRNLLFVLQGLGLALLALAFVSAVYLFPIVLAPQRPVLATLGFLVFSPLLFGLILLMYAHTQAVPEPDE